MSDSEKAALEILDYLENGPVALEFTESEQRQLVLMRIRQLIDKHLC